MEEENRFIAFAAKHWSKILLVVLSIACVAAWTERFMKKDAKQSSQDFVLAHQIYERFTKGEYLAEELIESTENILKRHKELHPKYDAMLSLTYLSQGSTAKASHYARSLISRASQELPEPYKKYAETTLLITEGKLDEAYRSSLVLHTGLQGTSNYHMLDAMNNLRLFFLANSLQLPEERAAFWVKLSRHPSFSSIEPLFSAGSLSLKDFATQSL